MPQLGGAGEEGEDGRSGRSCFGPLGAAALPACMITRFPPVHSAASLPCPAPTGSFWRFYVRLQLQNAITQKGYGTYQVWRRCRQEAVHGSAVMLWRLVCH